MAPWSYWNRPRNQYGNKKVKADGKKFDSIRERNYYWLLKEREENGEISNLREQVKFEFVPPVKETYIKTFVRKPDEIRERQVQAPVNYVADFVYTDNATGEEVVVDVKSEATRRDKVYVLKKKMMLAFKGIRIKEVLSANM